MVYFICQTCQETLKKGQVEKHWTTTCPNCYILTCVDCSKEFQGDEYRAHTSCISEAEKYQGALYQGSKAEKKTPQDKWIDALGVAASAATGSLAKHMSALLDFPNVPRKRAKFINFARNSLNLHSEQLLTELFEEISKHLPGSGAPRSEQSAAAAGAAGGSGTPTVAVGGTKRPRQDESELLQKPSKWVKRVTAVLEAEQGRTMKKKALAAAVGSALSDDTPDKKVKKGVKKALEALADHRLVKVEGKSVTLL